MQCKYMCLIHLMCIKTHKIYTMQKQWSSHLCVTLQWAFYNEATERLHKVYPLTIDVMLPFQHTLQSWCLQFEFSVSPINTTIFTFTYCYQWIWITRGCQVVSKLSIVQIIPSSGKLYLSLSEVHDFHALCNETCSSKCNEFYASKNFIAFQIHKPCSSHGCW